MSSGASSKKQQGKQSASLHALSPRANALYQVYSSFNVRHPYGSSAAAASLTQSLSSKVQTKPQSLAKPNLASAATAAIAATAATAVGAMPTQALAQMQKHGDNAARGANAKQGKAAATTATTAASATSVTNSAKAGTGSSASSSAFASSSASSSSSAYPDFPAILTTEVVMKNGEVVHRPHLISYKATMLFEFYRDWFLPQDAVACDVRVSLEQVPLVVANPNRGVLLFDLCELTAEELVRNIQVLFSMASNLDRLRQNYSADLRGKLHFDLPEALAVDQNTTAVVCLARCSVADLSIRMHMLKNQKEVQYLRQLFLGQVPNVRVLSASSGEYDQVLASLRANYRVIVPVGETATNSNKGKAPLWRYALVDELPLVGSGDSKHHIFDNLADLGVNIDGGLGVGSSLLSNMPAALRPVHQAKFAKSQESQKLSLALSAKNKYALFHFIRGQSSSYYPRSLDSVRILAPKNMHFTKVDYVDRAAPRAGAGVQIGDNSLRASFTSLQLEQRAFSEQNLRQQDFNYTDTTNISQYPAAQRNYSFAQLDGFQLEAVLNGAPMMQVLGVFGSGRTEVLVEKAVYAYVQLRNRKEAAAAAASAAAASGAGTLDARASGASAAKVRVLILHYNLALGGLLLERLRRHMVNLDLADFTITSVGRYLSSLRKANKAKRSYFVTTDPRFAAEEDAALEAAEHYDIILVDEAQDIKIADMDKVLEHNRPSCFYLFADFCQCLYGKDPTLRAQWAELAQKYAPTARVLPVVLPPALALNELELQLFLDIVPFTATANHGTALRDTALPLKVLPLTYRGSPIITAAVLKYQLRTFSSAEIGFNLKALCDRLAQAEDVENIGVVNSLGSIGSAFISDLKGQQGPVDNTTALHAWINKWTYLSTHRATQGIISLGSMPRGSALELLPYMREELISFIKLEQHQLLCNDATYRKQQAPSSSVAVLCNVTEPLVYLDFVARSLGANTRAMMTSFEEVCLMEISAHPEIMGNLRPVIIALQSKLCMEQILFKHTNLLLNYLYTSLGSAKANQIQQSLLRLTQQGQGQEQGQGQGQSQNQEPQRSLTMQRLQQLCAQLHLQPWAQKLGLDKERPAFNENTVGLDILLHIEELRHNLIAPFLYERLAKLVAASVLLNFDHDGIDPIFESMLEAYVGAGNMRTWSDEACMEFHTAIKQAQAMDQAQELQEAMAKSAAMGTNQISSKGAGAASATLRGFGSSAFGANTAPRLTPSVEIMQRGEQVRQQLESYFDAIKDTDVVCGVTRGSLATVAQKLLPYLKSRSWSKDNTWHKSRFAVSNAAVNFSTVHSFKGLESERVLVLLPNDFQIEPPLLYTAMTRARSELRVVHNIDSLKLSLDKAVTDAQSEMSDLAWRTSHSPDSGANGARNTKQASTGGKNMVAVGIGSIKPW